MTETHHCEKCAAVIAQLKLDLADQTRRAEVAEAWQKRLTSIISQSNFNERH